MIKSVLSTVAILVCVSSPAACAAECIPLKESSLSDLYYQLGSVRDEAYIGYFLGPPEDGERALTKLIEFYSRSQCTAVVPEEVRQVFLRNELLERGRLVRAHQKMGNTATAAAEAQRAVELGRTVFKSAEWSEVELFALVAKADPSMEKEVREVMSTRTSAPKN